MRLALLCGLLAMAGTTPTLGGLLNLNKMVRYVTGKSPVLNYFPYACHCGLGGKGQPKDATDWCCQKHDCCYAHLQTHKCKTLTDGYKFTFSQGEVQCSDKGSWCEQQLCACDKEVALCLKRNLDTYNKSLRYYWRPRCQGAKPLC
ncbi:group IID secretory phospholipase A2 [Perognathus longimembris pacificus]|uniref:group IID secretory phospholipase A2 n=1 Tax=Perognathus longimembris pacificus TaxID=214514 RepID=UPI002018BF7B|nr:group IID secretory phospholipase A2 [Perognathus longimembris pacificus]